MDKKFQSDSVGAPRDGVRFPRSTGPAESARDALIARVLAPIRHCLAQQSAGSGRPKSPHSGLRLSAREVERNYVEYGSYVASAALYAATSGREGTLVPSTGRDARSANGARTLHSPRFKLDRITKGSRTAAKLQRTARPLGTAEKHQRYIERADSGSLSHAELDAALADGRADLERTAQLAMPDRNSGRWKEDVIAVRGNLAPSFEERCQVWRDVELLEPANRGLLLKLNPVVNPDFWTEICALPNCPPELQIMKGRRKVKRTAISDERLEEIMQWFRREHFGCERTTRWRPNCRGPGRRGTKVPAIILRDSSGRIITDALTVTVGRGGTIMWKIEASLPYQLDMERVTQLVDRFVAGIQAFSVPVCAVIHGPPKGGDSRNLHTHIVFTARPAKTASDGRWDFQHWADTKRSVPGSRAVLPRKVAAFSADDFAQRMRSRFVDLTNAALEEAGIATRLIAGTFKAAGLAREARISPTHSAYYQERRGQISTRGRRAAAQYAANRIAVIERTYRGSIIDARLLVLGLELDHATKQTPWVRQIRTAAAEYLALARVCAQFDRQTQLYALLVSAQDSSVLRLKSMERTLRRLAPGSESIELQVEIARERGNDAKIRSIGAAAAAAAPAVSELRKRRDMLAFELRQIPSMTTLADQLSALSPKLPAPPRDLASHAPQRAAEEEVLILVEEARRVLEMDRRPYMLHLAHLARHWTANDKARKYLAEVLGSLGTLEEMGKVWDLIHTWGRLALPATLPAPAPVSDAEFKTLEALFSARAAHGFGIGRESDQTWAADASYRLVFDLGPFVRAGYLKACYETGLADPQEVAHLIGSMFVRSSVTDSFAIGWRASAGKGEHRAISEAVSTKAREKAAWSGLDAIGQTMLAHLLWDNEFEALFGGPHHIPAHLKKQKFGPTDTERSTAADYFRGHSDARNVLGDIAPAILDDLTETLSATVSRSNARVR